MNFLTRFIHDLKGRHYARLASKLRCDLTEYVLAEENRIAICRHRASWHFTQSTSPAALAAREKSGGPMRPAFHLDGSDPPLRQTKQITSFNGGFEEKP